MPFQDIMTASPPRLNVAGEPESDAKSCSSNGLEVLLVQCVIMVAQWGLAYPFGVYGQWAPANWGSVALLCGVVGYLFFVSPRVHGDRPADWGLGGPANLRSFLHTATPWTRRITLGAVCLLVGLMICFNYAYWPEVAAFFRLRFPAVLSLRESFVGSIVVLLFGAFLGLLFSTCAIRYDNFCSALGTAFKISVPLCLIICLAAYAERGAQAFAHADPSQLALHAFSYLFWGFLQQLVFSGYFGTRMRRAVGPGGPPGSRLRGLAGALAGCGFAALVWAPAVTWALVRALPGEVGWAALPWLAAFSIPFGGVYGCFLARHTRRLLVATLTASFFATIHLPSYGLVAATFVLGIPLAYVFMEARNRNLVALSTVHSVLGVTLYWLFSGKNTGHAFYVDYHVGPWSVKQPTLSVLAVPLICLAVYAVLALWFWRALHRCNGARQPVVDVR